MLQRVCDSVPSGTREDSPRCSRNSNDSSLLQMCRQWSSGTLWKSRMMVQRAPPCASKSLLASMCAFSCLCLCIPSGSGVANSCPWIFIDRECGIYWVFLSISLCGRAGGSFVGLEQGHMVTAATMRLSEAALAKRQGLRVPVLQRHSMWCGPGFSGRMKEPHFHNTTAPGERNNSS